MIRVVESEIPSEDQLKQLVTDCFKHEKDYWKQDTWVTRKINFDNPRYNEANLVYVKFPPEYKKSRWGISVSDLGDIIVTLYFVNGNFLAEQNWTARLYWNDKEEKINVSYRGKDTDNIGRILKTSLKTSDKKPIFSLRGNEEDSTFFFTKDEYGRFIPYFGEVANKN